MAKVVILGAGIAGHTAAAFLKHKLGHKHQVTVISPSQYYQWIPSNIWVGTGNMKPDQVQFKLEKVYKRWKVDFHQAKATVIHPEGNNLHPKAFVEATYTKAGMEGQRIEIEYDYLINATGPRLNFAATEGLGPGKNSSSVCTSSHASEAWEHLSAVFEKAGKGEKQDILIGVGNPKATCQGAAFEYTLNVASEVRKRKLEKLIQITYITNEYELGDFGMGGAFIKQNGYVIQSKMFSESILAEHGIRWIKRAGVTKVEPNEAHYELLDGSKSSVKFDFAMLIPAFAGSEFKAFNRENEDITSKIFAPSGFMKVDADYSPKAYEDFSSADWPSTYQNPDYPNMFAVGIAFAPPHSISKPMKSPSGLEIFPSPPRTGMPSGVMGKIVADNISEMIKKGRTDLKHKASMGRMGAACIISVKYGLFGGLAATMTVNPVVPDWKKYPDYGRDLSYTVGEVGLAGHWMKLFLHYMFIHKAKGYPFWYLLPE
jgi:sulfide:quinone oxidoreductase